MAERSIQQNRNIETMKTLYAQRAYSDSEMAALLQVDRTTVYRTRRLMEDELSLPIYEESRGHYRLDPDSLLHNLRVTPGEALALYLGARRLQQHTRTNQADVANALYKLGQTLRKPLLEELARAAEIVLEQEQDPRRQQVLSVLVQGWLEGYRVQIRHRVLHGRLQTYTVSPYQLEPAVWGDGIYLIGHSDYHGGLVTFKVARIEEARLLPDTFAVPDDFDVHELLQHAWGIWHADGEPETVRLRFSAQVTPRVKESIWHPSQDIRDLEGGGCEWSADIATWQEMVPWIRGWGADCEVLEPEALRREIERHIRRLNEVYGITAGKDSAPEAASVAFAHSRNNEGQRHPLVKHLTTVASLAAEFAGPLHAPELARTLGLWHDLGKFHPDFQRYLHDVERPDNTRRRGPDHKAAGVRLALEHDLGPAALLLQGHHGGLCNLVDLQRWYAQHTDATENALSLARAALSSQPPEPPCIPAFAEHDPLAAEFFLRMLFSTLVDADFLDTEAHFNTAKSRKRGTAIDMATLWQRFSADQQRRFGDTSADDLTTVNRSRRDIYQACVDAATEPTGLFRLAVPTGGGKTRSGMAFALRHALTHGQRRIVVAVPYITITQQTAAVYRAIFDQPGDAHPAVLEHHSSAAANTSEASEYDPQAIWRRLAAENWDAPIIVTTTAQLFESLFANSTSRCRKLHRLAKSVIILDEAQSLPAHLLDPMLDGLRELCTHYGSTVVLSSATQPAFAAIKPFQRLEAREVVPSPEQHFEALKRVKYEWHVDRPLSWDDVAHLMHAEKQALAICNTKQDALDLLDALDDPEALHLSTLLCGRHRMAVIEEVKRRLQAGEPCRLVATQVVEAGVDIDFPLVLRALGPLDSIVQAGGRANREGKLDRGRVIVFVPASGGLPPGAYQRATETTRTLLNSGPLNLHDPLTMHRYFEKLYALEDTDGKQIQKRRRELDYPEVASRFRLIDDETVSVVITTYGSEPEQQRLRIVLNRLRAGAPPTRQIMRALQPYTVSLWQHKAQQFIKQGLLAPQDADGIAPGLWEWMGAYDSVRGLEATRISADTLVF